jgi:regulator of protease activity HflC (stomatin/prohibitin superfamily)
MLRQRGGTISKRIGHDYRTFFGFVVIVPENYALLIHRFKKYHAQY